MAGPGTVKFFGFNDGSEIGTSSSCNSSNESEYEGDISVGLKPYDSEIEGDIDKELDGIHFGVTPPRQTRREKKKTNQRRRRNSATERLPINETTIHIPIATKEHHFNHQKSHSYQHHPQRHASNSFSIQDSNSAFKKPAQLVQVDQHTRLKSIRLQKLILQSGTQPRRLQSSPNLKTKEYHQLTSTDYLVSQASETIDSCVAFHKEVSLLAKLGGKLNNQSESFTRRSLSAEGNLLGSNHEPLHVEFDALLWLELKAWQSGRSIDQQDSYLENVRNSIDNALNKIMTFNFKDILLKQLYKLSDNCNISMAFAEGVQNTLDIDKNEAIQLAKLLSEENKASDNESTHCYTYLSHINTSLCKSLPRSIQTLSMGIIRMALDGIDKIEELYPTMDELSKHHDVYADRIFKNNYKVLIMWLKITKDLYHKLNVVASLVGIKESNIVSWRDWHEHGLGLRCLKTQARYQSSYSTKEASNSESEGIPTTGGTYHSRHSFTEYEQTSTSRYREFVEKSIHQYGLAKLGKIVKSAIHSTLWRANQALKVPDGQHHSRKDSPLVYTPSVKNALHHHGMAMQNNPVMQPQIDIELLKISDFKPQPFGEYGVWGSSFRTMELPSFLELYLFLCNVSLDIALECIRYRLEHRPKGEPSSLSVKQLIIECKEVIYGGIFGKEYYLEMALSVITSDDKDRLSRIENKILEFETDLHKMLMLYFDYLQSLLQTLQRLHSASDSLKSVFEEHWLFAKEICPYIRGGEAEAGYKFCVFTAGFLDSIGHYLESSLDECMSEHSDEMSNCEDTKRRLVLDCFRKHKRLFNETRQRSAKGLGFAKMLHKDIGIAAEYRLKLPYSKIIDRLEESHYAKVEFSNCPFPDVYDFFVPMSLVTNEKQILQLLSVICGFEDSSELNHPHNGYVLILNTSSAKNKSRRWQRRIVTVVPTVDMKISLSKIQVEGMIIIACNSYQLSVYKKSINGIFGYSLELISDQTSSHETIAAALNELKVSSRSLADVIVSSVEQAHNNLNYQSHIEVDECDANVVRSSYIETMHVCFSLGFEYLRELTRLLTERNRKSLVPILIKFAKMWMKFATHEIESGRGTRPRWAASGLDFIVMVSEPQNMKNSDEEIIKELKGEITNCIRHIIGKSDSGKNTPVYRASSPAPLHRTTSQFSNSSSNSNASSKLSPLVKQMSENDATSPKYLSRKTSANLMGSFFSPEVIFTGSDTEDMLSPLTIHSPSTMDLFGPCFKSETPMDKIQLSLKAMEQKRDSKLKESNIIGHVTDVPPLQSILTANVSVRKVSFKWQLGLKLGEGQFGKVYSCVNLDTGELLAMKQVPFQPNDYSAIQEIADEFKSIEGLRHESIVSYYGVELHKSEMLIFMEFCADGTIADVAKLGLPESMIRDYSLQILKAISFLHRNRIVHRDIKGANIFLSSDGLIKLGDFGSAVKLRNTLHTLAGEVNYIHGTTVGYMAPEVITEDKSTGYGRAADIWSFGCVVVEMLTGKAPWHDCDNMYMIMFRVGNGASPDIPDTLNDEGKEFLSYCFIPDPVKRWTADMLEGHTFVKVHR